MRYKTKRAKATDIPAKVKQEVYERDGGLCIFCGKPGLPNAHFISRAHGGLGVAENIVTACPECHDRMDNSTKRKFYLQYAEDYLRWNHENWNWEKLIYTKGGKDEQG